MLKVKKREYFWVGVQAQQTHSGSWVPSPWGSAGYQHVEQSCRARCQRTGDLVEVCRPAFGLNIGLFSHQAGGGANGGGGTTVTAGNEGVTLLLLTSPENASLSCEESRLIPSFSPLTPLTTSVTLIGGPSAKMRERGWAQPQSREPIRRQRTELGEKNNILNITTLLWRHSLRDTHFFLPVFAPPR